MVKLKMLIELYWFKEYLQTIDYFKNLTTLKFDILSTSTICLR